MIKKILEQINFEKFNNKKVAVCLPSYNRPEYFREVMNSVSKNSCSSYVPIFVFCDGGKGSKQQEIYEIFKEFKDIKNKFFIKRKLNFGCSKNLIDARRVLFDELNFDLILMLEDDLVISDQYIENMFNMYIEIKNKHFNLGILQGWNQEDSYNIKNINTITYNKNISHLWGYIISKEVWNNISAYLYDFEEKFLKINGDGEFNKNYFESQHVEIRKYMWLHIPNFDFKQLKKMGNCLIDPYWNKKIKQMLEPDVPVGQDVNTELAMMVCGYVRLQTELNRSKYIGKVGLHCTDEIWEKYGFDKILYFNEEDDIKKTWKIKYFLD